MFNSLKGKLFGNKENDNVSEIDIMKDENKILKDKLKCLFEENEKLKQTMTLEENETSKKSNINKIFKDFKQFLFENKANNSIQTFKHFLSENLIYSNIDEEDIDYLNTIDITDQNWIENKHIYKFKQRILEKNYKEMFKNAIIFNELKDYEKDKRNLIEKPIISIKQSTILKTSPNEIQSQNISVPIIQSKNLNNPTSVLQIEDKNIIKISDNSKLNVFEILNDKEQVNPIVNENKSKKFSLPNINSVNSNYENLNKDIKIEKSSIANSENLNKATKIKEKSSLTNNNSNNEMKKNEVPKENIKKDLFEMGDGLDFEEFESENLLDALHNKSSIKKLNEIPQQSVHNDELCKL